jgi:putative serine/threonine protein kinase
LITSALEPGTTGTEAMLAIEKLVEEPYASIVCYPRASRAEIRKRMKELERLSVNALEFVGEKRVFNVNVLGKGCVGIVVLADRQGERVALKIRRVDADRVRMQQEAKLLRKANSVHVGPKLLATSRNFLCMQFIDGELLPKWLKKKRSKRRIRTVLQQILEQCWQLDRINLDHGELSHAPKHVIVNGHDKPFIVDFESASLNRRPANVTSICQFLFIGSETAKDVTMKLGAKNNGIVAEALRCYKNERSIGNFCRVLNVCGL